MPQHETRVRELTAEKTALHRELLQARLVVTETEETNQRLQQELAEATKGLAAEQAECERLRGSLREARGVMSAQRVQLAEARQLLEGMSCELGILSSRYNRTLEENTALRGARKRRPWREPQQQPAPGQQAAAAAAAVAGAVHGQQLQQQQPLAAAAAQEAADQVRPGTPPSAAARGGDDGMLEHALPQTPCGAEAAAQRLVLTHGPAQLMPSSSLLQGSAATGGAAAPGRADTSSISSEGASSGSRSRVISSSGGSSGADDDSYDTAEDNTEIMSWLAGGGSSSPVAASTAEQQLKQQPAVPQLTLPSLARCAASGASSGSLQVSASALGAGAPPPAVCPHGQPEQGSCLACMCQRYLAHTAVDNAALAPAQQGTSSSDSSSLLMVSGSAAVAASEPAAAAAGAAQLQGPYQQQVPYKDLLRQADSQRAALQQEVAALQVQLQGARTEVQEMSQHLDQLQGRGSALARCSVTQLQQLEALLESSARSVRAAMMQRTIEEQRRASADSHMCSACHEAPRCIVLGCGHQTCSKCGESAPACPLCSAPVATRIWLSC
jgi:hypothetical protein